MGPFRKEHHNLGTRPVLPIVFTKHAVKRYQERYDRAVSDLGVVQEHLEERAKSAVWAGKSKDGRLLLAAGDVHFIVQRWECKYRVLTVLANQPITINANADIQPRNPNRHHMDRELANYREK